MRAGTLIFLFLILRTLDSLTTWHLLKMRMAVEINPLVWTESLWRFILSPGPLFVGLAFLACVIYAERNAHRFDTLIKGHVLPIGLFFFPLYFLFWLFMVVLSNTLGVLGYGTPIIVLGKPFQIFTDSLHLQLSLANTAFILVTLPLFIPLTKRLYSQSMRSHLALAAQTSPTTLK